MQFQDLRGDYKNPMRLLNITIGLIGLSAVMCADTVTMRDGTVLTGIFLGGSGREVKIEAGDLIQTLDVPSIARIEFNADGESRPRGDSSGATS